MESNKDEPLSLRAIGAFAVYGTRIREDSTVLENWSEDELKEALTKYIDQFCDDIKNVPGTAFTEKFAEGYHGELREALYYIHNGEYQKALEAVGDKRGCFTNGDVNINDAIRNLCMEEIRK
ncbi:MULTISPECIES: hypothetical protein [unclassified Butyrivibrio]|uniref:hypothetical protein n=1 Tax=unclassified Butyrivibrio TaxID=2639466 RepID=UPI00040FF7B8|nr:MULTISPECIES: hypothetical protein [unclassified Butyrivibrio]